MDLGSPNVAEGRGEQTSLRRNLHNEWETSDPFLHSAARCLEATTKDRGRVVPRKTQQAERKEERLPGADTWGSLSLEGQTQSSSL